LFSKYLMLFNKEVTSQLGCVRVVAGAQPVQALFFGGKGEVSAHSQPVWEALT